MAYDYSDLLQQAKQWAYSAHTAGWLSTEAVQTFEHLDAPTHLFANTQTRPLIVAFMGGTGVGKSALLNRLAGQAIAKSGIERPTSREVTLYYHHTLALPDLASQLPLTKINLAQHSDDSKQYIIWLDMPDFDSTELANKQQVLSWLPHIDVLIYVVSPERYRDEKAWRLLLAEGAKHAWVFVFNQWDKGQDIQFDDFADQLAKAGFIEPLIFKTSCTDEGYNDDFQHLKTLLIELAQQNTVRQLQQRNTEQRIQALQHHLQQLLIGLGETQQFAQLKNNWQKHWQTTTEQLQQGMVWAIQQLAQHYADHASDLLNQPISAVALWDDWAQTRFNDSLHELLDMANQQQLVTAPFKPPLTALSHKASKMVQNQLEQTVRIALANPGTVWQRSLLKMLKICEISLPLLAMTWVSYQVFSGYYHSNMQEVPYLGVDFAIHSSLLIGLTWLIPFFILKKAEPSLKTTALRGLNQGLTTAFAVLECETTNIIEQVQQQHAEQCQQLAQLIANCVTDGTANIAAHSPLQRMLKS